MPPLAHSARPAKGIPAQEYAAHVGEVFRTACDRAARAAGFSPRFGAILESAVGHAGLWHDLGKLDPANQATLRSCGRDRLPINHCDAGVAHLMREAAESGSLARVVAAYLVFAHHKGLPNSATEEARQCFLRDEKPTPGGRPLHLHTDATLDDLVRLHRAALSAERAAEADASEWQVPLLFRIALSCLVDADHADTAHHYGEAPRFHDPPLRPVERLAALDKYVSDLGAGKTDDRNRLRRAVYDACRYADTVAPLVECDSPVGTGKTTAVMAHLLRAAIDKKLRRVFVVLPYTNIITQSVGVYRRCLVLPGEDPERIVVAHHHRAQFQEVDSRHFTALWHAPVVVTTAVQFFESLADHKPAGLRKLHQLPGSAVFVDESHAAMPAKLWPRAWDWLKQLAADYGCHFVFGSGSLNRVWRLPEVDPATPSLPPLVRLDVGTEATDAEKKRVKLHTCEKPLGLHDFAEWATAQPGPRLVIVNTVQTAAALARHIGRESGRCRVEHLSTALCPADREKTLDAVKARLDPAQRDADWTLVATSCVEAGVDISFRVGFRERAGLTSLLQTAGRVNRSNEYGAAVVWDFRFAPGELVAVNPGLKDAAEILGRLVAEKKVGPEWCTEALKREILQQYRANLHADLARAELELNFPEVAELFRVIEQETATVVVAAELLEKLERGERVSWQELQQGSVSMYRAKAEKLHLPLASPELYRWHLPYDGFLGYMAGVLEWLENDNPAAVGGFIV